MEDDAVWIRYELVSETSNKFWEIRREGSALVVRYGKVGSRGRTQRKEFDSVADCVSAIQAKIGEKKRKGYLATEDSDAPSELWQAVSSRNLAKVEELLASGADVTETLEGISIFEHALRQNKQDVAIALFDAGGDPKALSSNALNLVWATCTNRVDIVRAFIEAGARADMRAMMGSAIGVAVGRGGRGNREVVELLIAAGADLDVGGVISTPLSKAIEHGFADCAVLLIEAGASTDPALSANQSVVALAAKTGQAEVMIALIRAGADLEAPGSFMDVDETGLRGKVGEVVDAVFDVLEGKEEGGATSMTLSDFTSTAYAHATPLIVASGEGHVECVERLLEAGVDLEALDESGRSAIEHARARNRGEIVDRLIAAGASPEARRSPTLRLLLAAEVGDEAALRAALADGAPIDEPDTRDSHCGRTALMIAAQTGHLGVVDLLLEAGADPARSDDEGQDDVRTPGAFYMRGDCRGRTALMLSAEQGHFEIVALLLKIGVPTDPKDRENETALTLACGNGHVDIVGLLLAAGADVDQRGRGRRTPLIASLENGGEAAAPVLIDAGAKLDLKCGDGETAIHVAALMEFDDIVRRLLDAGANPTIKNREAELPRDMTNDKNIEKRLRSAENAWIGTDGGNEDLDLEVVRAEAARARTPQIDAPSLEDLEVRYEYDAVIARLQDAETSEFRTLLAEIADACGGSPEDRRADFGGYGFSVRTGHLDLDGLIDLNARMLERGAFVFSCDNGSAWGTPGRLLALPTTDAYEAMAVMGTNGVNEDQSTEDIIRWHMQRFVVQPFSIHWLEHDLIKGRFHEPIEDCEELAQSMFDLCHDIVDQSLDGTLDGLISQLEKTRSLYFWWD